MAPQRSVGAGEQVEAVEYAGRYRLLERLGSGGMGVVHLARSDSGLHLAVKVVHPEFAKDPEFRRRFRQEVAAARRVSGAFTAPVVDADPEAARPWMATLHIPGPTLAELVKRNGPLAPTQLRRLMAGLAEALRDIHRAGVVHRDLKPSNVLLADDGPKVIDFGISRPKDSELRTETGKLIGSPPFMAPEQFRRPKEVGPAADIFALGSLLVHAATGRAPWDSDSPYLVAYQVVHNEADLTALPPSLAPLVERCLSKDPEDRPTADELMTALRDVAASYDTQAFIPVQRTRDHRGGTGSPGAWESEPAPTSTDTGPDAEAEASTHLRTGVGGAHTTEAVTGGGPNDRDSDGSSTTATRPPRPTPRRRRSVALAVTAAAVTLCAVAAVLLWPGDGDGRTAGSASGRPSGGGAPAFRPWRVDLPGGSAGAVGSTPLCAYGDGALYCTQPGLPGAALDPVTGEVDWSREADADAAQVPTLAPRLAGGLLHTLGDGGRALLALDPASGEVRRRAALSARGDSLEFAGDTVLLGAADGTVTGLDAATGKRRWRQPVAGQLPPVLAVFGDTVFAARQSADGLSTRVTALAAHSGAPRWEQRFEGSLRPVGVTSGGAVVLHPVGTDGRTAELIRYDPADHTRRRVPLRLPLDGARVSVHGERAHLVAAGGAVVAVDLAAGAQLWRTESAVSEGSAPVADGRRVYFSAPDGRLLALAADDGHPLGQTRARGALAADRVVGQVPVPILAEGRVYASAPDGSVFGVGGANPGRW